MTIPVSTIVNVTVTLTALFPARMGFGTLLIVTAETDGFEVGERVRLYNSPEGLAEDWPVTSEAYISGNTYFAQSPRPTSLKIGIRGTTDVAGVVVGNMFDVATEATPLVDAIQLVTSGAITFTFDNGTVETLTGIDFSTVTAISEIDDIVNAAIATGSVELQASSFDLVTSVSGGAPKFWFTWKDGTVGSASVIDYLKNDPAGLPASHVVDILGVSQSTAQSLQQGVSNETIAQALVAIEQADSEWYGLAFTKEVREQATFGTAGANGVEDAAAFVESRTKVFFNTTNDLRTVQSADDTTAIATVLKDLNYRRTLSVFAKNVNQYSAQSIAGRAFTVNFEQPDSVITLMFKDLPAVSVEKLTPNELANIRAKNCNVYTTIGKTTMFLDGVMADGTFFDIVHGTDWLSDAIQTEVFGTLKVSPTRVPYTDTGITQLEDAVIRVFKEAVSNGLVAPGTAADGTYLPRGYVTSVVNEADVSQSDKAARQYDGLSGLCLGAGAIHGAQINVVFEQ